MSGVALSGSHLQVVTNGEKPSVPTSLRSSGWRPVDTAWTSTNADFFRFWGNRRIVCAGAMLSIRRVWWYAQSDHTVAYPPFKGG